MSVDTELLLAIALGSNLPPADEGPFAGDAEPRLRALAGALIALEAEGLRLLASSAVFETEAQGVPEPQPAYLNACLLALAPKGADASEVLELCSSVERAAGRDRKGDLAARPLDLDLLLSWSSGPDVDWVLDGPTRSETLEIPHPRLNARDFVLVPLKHLVQHLPLPASTADCLSRTTESGLRRIAAPSFPKTWGPEPPGDLLSCGRDLIP